MSETKVEEAGSAAVEQLRAVNWEKRQDEMSELQATLEYSVELYKFYNVDLFQRGFYQIRTTLKIPPKTPAKVEVSLPKGINEGYQMVHPPRIQNEVAYSKTFQILYRNEDVLVNDAILFRLHTLVDSAKLEENLENLGVQLLLELWFHEEEEGAGLVEKMECVSSRLLNLHFSPTKGLHHHIPLLFDYFHLAAVEITVHGMLIAIHQPYLTMPRPPKSSWAAKPGDQSTLEAVYFTPNTRPTSGVPSLAGMSRFQQAHIMHKMICKVLLSAYESLQTTFHIYLSKMNSRNFKLEHRDCHKRLEKVISDLQGVSNEDDLIQTAMTDITQLCAENVVLWNQFLERVTLHGSVLCFLAQDHHTTRVRRFAEGFFTCEYPKITCLSCYEQSIHGHHELAALVRNSEYYQKLPPLPVECLETDGDPSTLPLIFEDVYHDNWLESLEANRRRSQEVDRPGRPWNLSKSDSVSSQQSEAVASPKSHSKAKKFIKNIKPEAFKRPSSYSCSEMEAPASKNDAKGVVLVGYRKVPPPEEVPAGQAVELGTLSPVHGGLETGGLRTSAAVSSSMSSLLARTCWSRASTSSLPELSHLYGESMGVLSSRASQGYFSDKGSDGASPNLDTPQSRLRMQFKASRAYTAPVPSSTSSSSTPTPLHTNVCPVGSQLGSKPSTDTLMSSPGTDQGVADLSLESASQSSSELPDSSLPEEGTRPQDLPTSRLPPPGQPPSGLDPSSKKLDFQQRDFEKLASSISQALGEESIQSDVGRNPESAGRPGVGVDDDDDDHSDDSTNVVNGYDAFMDSHCGREDVTPPNEDNGAPPIFASSQPPGCPLVPRPASALLTAGHQRSDQASYSVDSSSSSSSPCAERKMTVLELLREEYKCQQDESREEGENSLYPCFRASSDTDILRTADEQDWPASSKGREGGAREQGMPRARMISSSSSFPELYRTSEVMEQPRLVSIIGHNTVNFITLREELKMKMKYQGHLYSESSTLASSLPYFQTPDYLDEEFRGIHLIVCVHGLDGNSADLRLVRTYIEMALPGYRLEFLMSERNQDTFADFEVMTNRLVDEVLSYIDLYGMDISRISFVGHSLGNIIIRSALAKPEMTRLLSKMYTFLSLSGPHLGTLYNTSGLVNMGMWFMQKWKKSGSLLQLSLKDSPNPRQSFLYRLSQKPVLQHFRHVLLVGSSQDRYVPYHSSRIEYCKAAQRDTSVFGTVYKEMVEHLLRPVVDTPSCKLVRYDVFHALPNTANTIIGRAAHIAVLDSELFIEKFMTVAALKYFK